jgi:transcriptional regulator with XRE-family HTH domain
MDLDLKAAREAADLSPSEAANALEIGISTLWRYENNKTKRKDYELVKRMESLYASKQAEKRQALEVNA